MSSSLLLPPSKTLRLYLCLSSWTTFYSFYWTGKNKCPRSLSSTLPFSLSYPFSFPHLIFHVLYPISLFPLFPTPLRTPLATRQPTPPTRTSSSLPFLSVYPSFPHLRRLTNFSSFYSLFFSHSSKRFPIRPEQRITFIFLILYLSFLSLPHRRRLNNNYVYLLYFCHPSQRFPTHPHAAITLTSLFLHLSFFFLSCPNLYHLT